MTLDVLSAGAAQGVVGALRREFLAATGADIRATFGAVGAMRAKLVAGAPCDVVILTAALIAELTDEGRVAAGTSAPLGRVRTGIAVRVGEPFPDIADGAALRIALLAATGILIPDPELATAGIHFVDTLTRLGIRDAVRQRLRPHANGATAMRELARATEPGLIGCTQITEIRYTPGVALVGPLPAEFGLETVYTVAVGSASREPELGRRFAEMLAGPAALGLRESAGFE